MSSSLSLCSHQVRTCKCEEKLENSHFICQLTSVRYPYLILFKFCSLAFNSEITVNANSLSGNSDTSTIRFHDNFNFQEMKIFHNTPGTSLPELQYGAT